MMATARPFGAASLVASESALALVASMAAPVRGSTGESTSTICSMKRPSTSVTQNRYLPPMVRHFTGIVRWAVPSSLIQ